MTREELRAVKTLHISLQTLIGLDAGALRKHPGAVIGVLGILAEDVTRAAGGSSTPIDRLDIEDAAGYLRTLRSLKKGGL